MRIVERSELFAGKFVERTHRLSARNSALKSAKPW
jgi:hypothetical protein